MIRYNEENFVFPLFKMFFIWLQRRRIYFSFCNSKKPLKKTKQKKRFFAYFAISSSRNCLCAGSKCRPTLSIKNPPSWGQHTGLCRAKIFCLSLMSSGALNTLCCFFAGKTKNKNCNFWENINCIARRHNVSKRNVRLQTIARPT